MKESALTALGRKEEAGAVKTQILAAPPRDPALPAKQIDLSAFYNASLYDGRNWEAEDLNLAALPETCQPSAAAPAFDLRGIIQLRGNNEKLGANTFPDRIAGITIGAPAAGIHFLLGAASALGVHNKKVEIGSLEFHYADGSKESQLLVNGVNIADYWHQPDEKPAPSLIVWTGRNTQGKSQAFRLAHFVWKNPHPDKAIKTIDFISAKAPAAPFIVGITLE